MRSCPVVPHPAYEESTAAMTSASVGLHIAPVLLVLVAVMLATDFAVMVDDDRDDS